MIRGPGCEDHLWCIVLSGGEGERTRPFVEKWLGRHLPKQYCVFVGTRSMLQHTVDRAKLLVPLERVVVVTAEPHCRKGWVRLQNSTRVTVLAQPANRDTGAGILFPLAYLKARDPEATAVIFPSDHFVHPENRFLATVRRAARIVGNHHNRVVLLGAIPDHPETEYGWIEPGPPIASNHSSAAHTVLGFREKPVAAIARHVMTAGGLWNTLVVVARVKTLWRLAQDLVPEVASPLEAAALAVGTPDETSVLESAYSDLPTKSFSLDFLTRTTPHMAVVPLDGVSWSDWGRPERIVTSLSRLGKIPAFPLEHVRTYAGEARRANWFRMIHPALSNGC